MGETPQATTGATELAEAAMAGDRRALAKLLTAVENRTPTAEVALRRLYPVAGKAHLVARLRAANPTEKPILLAGHADTVGVEPEL